ncbi:hypothetical protein ACHQM5_017956 [Ranunculus cassubicifolius]
MNKSATFCSCLCLPLAFFDFSEMSMKAEAKWCENRSGSCSEVWELYLGHARISVFNLKKKIVGSFRYVFPRKNTDNCNECSVRDSQRPISKVRDFGLSRIRWILAWMAQRIIEL